jgi:hypothetical protein
MGKIFGLMGEMKQNFPFKVRPQAPDVCATGQDSSLASDIVSAIVSNHTIGDKRLQVQRIHQHCSIAKDEHHIART